MVRPVNEGANETGQRTGQIGRRGSPDTGTDRTRALHPHRRGGQRKQQQSDVLVGQAARDQPSCGHAGQQRQLGRRHQAGLPAPTRSAVAQPDAAGRDAEDIATDGSRRTHRRPAIAFGSPRVRRALIAGPATTPSTDDLHPLQHEDISQEVEVPPSDPFVSEDGVREVPGRLTESGEQLSPSTNENTSYRGLQRSPSRR
jgi:hypothetical protein